MIEAVRIAFDVACAPDHAFATWTSRASSWWPREHTISREAVREVVFEPRVGGRIYERTIGGEELEWGRVTAWDPPRLLAYSWHIATEPSEATDVEIRFVELDRRSTRVEIQHDGWDRLGDERGQVWRRVNRGGWDGTLPAFVEACAAAPQT